MLTGPLLPASPAAADPPPGSPPLAPTVISTDYPSDATSHGGRGVAGDFTFTANSPDVTAFVYGWSNPPGTTMPVDDGVSVTISLAPPRDGLNVLHVYARDSYGRPGPTTRYQFLVWSPPSPIGHWPLTDLDFQGFRASTGGPDLVPGGDVTWTPDTYLIEASTPSFDAVAETPENVPGAATADVSQLDTSGSFSVAAWLRPADLTGDMTAAGQDGVDAGGFQLGIRQIGDPPAPHWAFTMPTGSAAASPLASAYRPVPIAAPDAGRWTHLVGAFNAATGSLQLYVDGVLAAEASHAGTPWQATGPFTVGRGFAAGEPDQWWRGGITNVILWNRVAHSEDLHGVFWDPDSIRPDQYGVLAPHRVGLWSLDAAADCWCGDAFDYDRWSRHLYLTGWDDFPATSGFVLDDGVPGRHAAWFDGQSGYASTTSPYDPVPRPVLRTDRSFAVMAWARIDGGSDDSLPGEDSVVLAQGGDETDAFQLGYRASDGRWVFRVRGSDDATAPDLAVAASGSAAQPDEWTHVSGVYDAASSTVTIYIDGVVAGSAPVPSPPTWSAPGSMTLGAGVGATGMTGFFPGRVSRIEAYSGIIPAWLIPERYASL